MMENEKRPKHDDAGNLVVPNLSAWWLPEFTLTKKIGGTIYSVTGSYEGIETLDKKLERIMAHNSREELEESHDN